MLAAVAARLTKQSNNVWVDLGGGTGVRSPACFATLDLGIDSHSKPSGVACGPACGVPSLSAGAHARGNGAHAQPLVSTQCRRSAHLPQRAGFSTTSVVLHGVGAVQENVLMMAEYTDLSRFKAIYGAPIPFSVCFAVRLPILLAGMRPCTKAMSYCLLFPAI
jgi:hypothetical protein